MISTVNRQGRWTGPVLLGLLTLIGLAMRIVVAHQSFYGDELATYWIITTRGLGGLISALYNTHDEITPPLLFICSWITAHLGHAPELIRLPSLVAGTLTIPVVYLLGRRTVGAAAAVMAVIVTTFSPFMIYYSTEARAYGLLMFLVTTSTLAMLTAIDTGRRRWWVLYAVCICGAFYTHYTSIFYMAVQFAWVMWAVPEARRPALIATAAAAAVALPWLPAVINANNSPTTAIMSDLSPFTPSAVAGYLAHWSLGHPYPVAGNLTAVPGVLSLVLLGVALAGAALGVALRPGMSSGETGSVAANRGAGAQTTDRLRAWHALVSDRRRLLIVGLLLATPAGEALESATGTHVFGIRNLASSWPALVLSVSALLVVGRVPIRLAVCGLVSLAFVLSGVKMLSTRFARPDYQSAAHFINDRARPGDIIIDESGLLSPGPLSGLDPFRRPSLLTLRAGSPQESDHPFSFADPISTLQSALGQAAARRPGTHIFLLDGLFPHGASKGPASRAAALGAQFPADLHPIGSRTFPGFIGTRVREYSVSGG